MFASPIALLRHLVAIALLFAFAAPTRADDPVLAGIRAETAALVGAPRAYQPTSKKGLAAQAAIKRGDFATAGAIAEEVLARSRMQPWRFGPFDDFLDTAVAVNDEAYRAQLDAWVAAEPDNAAAMLIRSHYHLETAWARRGHAFSAELTRRQMSGFLDNIAKATEDADSAIKLRGDISAGHFLRTRSLATSGKSAAFEASFEAGIARFPGYFPLYELRLDRLAPKWSGSAAIMVAFVERHAGKTDAKSPMRLLYLVLYAKLLDAASVNCAALRDQAEKLRPCVAAQMEALIPSGLEDKAVAALRALRSADALARELDRILFSIITTTGGEAHAGAILQAAADVLGNDNRLKRDGTGPGNYALDIAAGLVWSRAGFYDNALTKYLHALEDAARASFPDEESRDRALIGVFGRLAGVSNALAQPAKVIAYTEAAIALGGYVPNKFYYLACLAYHRLKLFAEGAAECAALQENGDGPYARYYFALNQQALGKTDAALAAFIAIADADGEIGANAVIQMSLIHSDRRDLKAMLAVLNAHPAIYDPRVNSKSNIAVAYNNRCYAYMELGELQKALDDCTMSLRFASLPDAYTKQQKLVTLLKAKKI